MLILWLVASLLLSSVHWPLCRLFVSRDRPRASRVLVPLGSSILTSVLVNGEGASTSAARLLLVTTLMALVEIDILVRRLPREISYPAAMISFLLLGCGRPEQVWSMIVGALAPMSVLAITSWCSRRQLGSGDVRMWPLLGVQLGAESMTTVVFGFVSSFVVAGIVVIGLVLSGRARRTTTIPFGPFLAAGTMLALCVSPSIG